MRRSAAGGGSVCLLQQPSWGGVERSLLFVRTMCCGDTEREWGLPTQTRFRGYGEIEHWQADPLSPSSGANS